jgi:hypothetical protein
LRSAAATSWLQLRRQVYRAAVEDHAQEQEQEVRDPGVADDPDRRASVNRPPAAGDRRGVLTGIAASAGELGELVFDRPPFGLRSGTIITCGGAFFPS